MSSRQPDLKKEHAPLTRSDAPAHTLVATMVASASAGMIARIPCHPLDTCKAKLQVQKGRESYRNFFDVLRKTWRGEGLRGLYRGFGTAFVGSAPAGCLYFTTYEQSKDLLTRFPLLEEQGAFVAHFLSGILAETVSCVLWVPIDVVKERLQVQSTLQALRAEGGMTYRGNIHALTAILQSEGLRGLYRGYGATLLSYGPFSAFYFVFYEQFKKLALHGLNGGSSRELDFPAVVTCAVTAGSLASLLTNGLDMAKLRMQIERKLEVSGSRTFNYRNIFDGLRQIVQHEGFSALFKGAGARMAFQAPTTAIALTAFEKLKGFYAQML